MSRKTKEQRRREAIKKLKELAASEPGTAHVAADQVLLELIDDPEVKKAWDNVSKWYA